VPVVPAVVMLAVEPLAALLAGSRLAGLALVGAAQVDGVQPLRQRACSRLARALGVPHRPTRDAGAGGFLEARGPAFRVALGDVGTVGHLFHGAIDDLCGLNEPFSTRRCRGELGCWADEP
jgi:hypothetical protein